MMNVAGRLNLLLLLLASFTAHAQFGDPAIAVSPPEPAPSDDIVITVSDTNSNGCVPRSATWSRVGNTIDVVEEQPAGGICLSVISPYSLDVLIGQLPAGDYSLRYFRDGAATPKASTTLSVRVRIPGTLHFGMPTYSAADDTPSAQVTVTREGGNDGSVSVEYATGTGTAMAGADFVAVNGRLRWADGDAGSRTFEVPILDPPVSLREKNLALILSNPQGGASLGDPAQAELRISGFENGPGGVIRFVDPAGGIPSGATVGRGQFVDLLVQRHRGAQGAASVNFVTRDGNAQAGSDYELPALVGAPVRDSLIITREEARVEEVRVNLALDHGRVGDLVLSLTAPDGTSVTLMDRPGAFGSFLGERNTEGNGATLSAVFPIDFRDGFGAGRISAEAAGADCGDAGIIGRDCGADFRPSGPGLGNTLGRFEGLLASGEWTLSVTDLGAGVTGTLVDWQLQLETSLGNVTASSLIDTPLQVPDGSDTDDSLQWQDGEDGARVVRVQTAFTSNHPSRFEAVLQGPQGASLRRGFAELVQFLSITGDGGLGTSDGDLRVSITMSDDPVPVGEPFSLTVAVSNNLGLQNGTRVALSLGDTDAVEILSAEDCSGDAAELRCEIEALPRSAAATAQSNSRQLQLRTTRAGRLLIVAEVAEILSTAGPGRIDDNTSNNLVLLEVEVQDGTTTGTEFQIGPGISGSWYDSSHDGEGFLIEILAGGQALAYWFTYDASGNQAWLFGTGTVSGNTLVIPTAFSTRGGVFGPSFDPEAVQIDEWGELRFVFSSCTAGMMVYSGPPGFGEGALQLERLTYIAASECPGGGSDGPGPVRASTSGSYFDRDRAGEGFLVEVRSATEALVYWFTYDFDGNQAWIVAPGRVAGDSIVVDQSFVTDGPVFGPSFDPSALNLQQWGSLRLTFDSCTSGRMTYDSVIGFGSSGMNLARISTLAGHPCTE